MIIIYYAGITKYLVSWIMLRLGHISCQNWQIIDNPELNQCMKIIHLALHEIIICQVVK